MILVTGGAGYIGMHVCVELLHAQYEVVVADNFSNSRSRHLQGVKEIVGADIPFYPVDLLDQNQLEQIFRNHPIEAVIHLAGLKAVGESVNEPLKYYKNNVSGSINLLEVMQKYSVKKIIFSSSATVYGEPHHVPITEDFPLQAINPYGQTKIMIEEVLESLNGQNPAWGITILRYFNPVGAHESGKIGEYPLGKPNNLMPVITQVALGLREQLEIYGYDYNTPDGTAIRDYIHVVDLAKGHVKALQKTLKSVGTSVYNLGTGKGFSVLELVKSFERVTDQKVPYVFTERRPGDVAQCYANPTKANRELYWHAEKTIEDMCKDAWRWQLNIARDH